MSRRGRTWAVIAGGGTAGHVIPAIAIADALVAAGHEPASIHFVGSRRGIEGRLVPAAGYTITVLPGRGVVRRLAWANLGALVGLVVAIGRAVVLLARRRPSVVVSVGGFASVPCVLAAATLGIPLVAAEQNAVPGAANRLAARVARAVAVSFPDTGLAHEVLTGNPVRPEILAVDRSPDGRAAARASLGLPPDAVVVAIAGGSLGSRRLNTAGVDLARRWAGREGWAIRHVVGERDWTGVQDSSPAPPGGGLLYQQVRYEDRMDLVYAAADIGVFRSGASTVAELTVVGLPSILVPLPGAPGDHQTANARALADAGAAVLVADGDASGERIGAEVDRVVEERGRLAAMAEAAKRLGRPGAATAVARLVEEHARG